MTEPHTLTVRGPEDLLAAVPCVLGFRPDSSIVMLTFGPGPAFHARVDLPHHADELPMVVGPLCHAVRRNGAGRVVLIAYTDDQDRAELALEALTDAFGPDVEVLEMLRSDGTCWYPMRPGFPDAAYDGVPHDVTTHPFAVDAVVRGRVTHPSRDALAGSLASLGGDAVAEVAGAVAAALERRPGRQRAAEAMWVRQVVHARLADGGTFTDADAGRLLVALLDLGLRDVAWSSMTHRNAAGQVVLWSDLVRRCPTELLPAPATLLGFAAWLAGSGALAWCALDRVAEVDPGYRMAALVGQALEEALPPSSWEPIPDEALPAMRDRAQPG